ncbi:hypothetical protein D3C80_2075360 [compost metagenome]
MNTFRQRQAERLGKGIAAEVEVNPQVVAAGINQIGGTGTVNIGQVKPVWIEAFSRQLCRRTEPRHLDG